MSIGKVGIRVSARKVEIWASTGKVGSRRVLERWYPGKCRKSRNPGEYQKGGILASIRNVGSKQVPERWDPCEYRRRDLGEYWEGKIRVSIGKGRIRVSIGKGRIRVSTRNVGSGRVPKMWNPGRVPRR